MVNRVTKSIAPLCVRLIVCWLLLVPSALSFAASNNTDLSSLLCSPSGQPLNPSAKAALRDLSEVLGETDNEPVPPNEHCEMCTLSTIVLPSPEHSACAATFTKQPPTYIAFETGLVHKAQGPPSGSRAPPTSI
ncbi:DUF2946 family protein [Fretibacter rubidus]|uniref:DUF2946 family protein n=1 Tax=Fretibacter rubidus TaxID=570162 RepID=UPI00352B21CB